MFIDKLEGNRNEGKREEVWFASLGLYYVSRSCQLDADDVNQLKEYNMQLQVE